MSNGNGTAPAPKSKIRAQLRETRAELELVKTRMQLEFLRRQERYLGLAAPPTQEDSSGVLQESSLFDQGWGTFVDPNLAFADAEFRYPLSINSNANDRAHGRDFPFHQNEQQLGYWRQASRTVCRTNSYAKGALRQKCNYIVHTGFKINAVAADVVPDANPEKAGRQVPDEVTGTVKLAQRVIDWFYRENNYTLAQREACRRVGRDGEWLWRYFEQPAESDRTGLVLIRIVEPEQVRDMPEGKTQLDGWSYGTRHQMKPTEDVQTVLEYHVVYKDPSTEPGPDGKSRYKGECVPANEILHVKDLDEDSTVKRGLPAYVYDTYQAFVRAGKLQRNLSESGALQAAIAWIEQFELATKQQVQAFQDNQVDFTRQDLLTGRTQQTAKYEPGTIPRIAKGKQFVPPPFNAGAAAQQGIVQGDLRAGGAPFVMPEYMVSGDAGNANYAATKETGAPFIRNAEAEQAHLGGAFEKPVRRQLDVAIKKGVKIDGELVRLPANTWQLIKLQVEPPLVIQRDPLQQSQKLVSEVQARVTSPQTAMLELGRDPDIEAANWTEWDEKNGGTFNALPFFGGEDGKTDAAGGESDKPFGQFTEVRQRRRLRRWLQEAGFTGTDRLGRHWVSGRLVKMAGAAAAGVKKAAKGAGQGLGKVGKALGHAEHVLKTKFDAGFATLPKPIQKILSVSAQVAFASYTAGQKAAMAIAAERGGTQHAERVGRILMGVDLIMAKVGPGMLKSTGVGATAALASSFVPLGSAAYIIGATVTNPVATIRAARKAIAKLRRQNTEAKSWTNDDISSLLHRLDGHAEKAEWYTALALAALDETGSLADALELADAAVQTSEPPGEENAADATADATAEIFKD